VLIKGQTKEAFGIGGRHLAKLSAIDTPGTGDFVERACDPCRFVSLSAVRYRREVGRIRLDEQAIRENQSQQIVIPPLLERHNTAERNVPPGFECELCQRMTAGVAVKNTEHAGIFGVANNGAGIVLGVAGVNNDGSLHFSRQGDLGRECIALGGSRRIVVMVIEAAFANRDGAVPEELPQLGDVRLRIERGGIVGVDAGRRENVARIRCGALGSNCRCIQ
jgi:hypothetical protein